jgi:hypothetical protein
MAWTVSAHSQSIQNRNYPFTGTTACLVSPGGFNPATLQALNSQFAFSTSSSTLGIQTFHGDGTGTVTATDVSITVPPTPGFVPSAASDTASYSFTYTIKSNGGFTVDLVPGSFGGNVTTGPRAGQTFTVNLPQLAGFVGVPSINPATLILASLQPTVETITYSNGDTFPRICHRSRVLIQNVN